MPASQLNTFRLLCTLNLKSYDHIFCDCLDFCCESCGVFFAGFLGALTPFVAAVCGSSVGSLLLSLSPLDIEEAEPASEPFSLSTFQAPCNRIGLTDDRGGICVFMRFGLENRLVVMIMLFVIM